MLTEDRIKTMWKNRPFSRTGYADYIGFAREIERLTREETLAEERERVQSIMKYATMQYIGNANRLKDIEIAAKVNNDRAYTIQMLMRELFPEPTSESANKTKEG